MVLRLCYRRLVLVSAALLALTLGSACAGVPASSESQSQPVQTEQANVLTDATGSDPAGENNATEPTPVTQAPNAVVALAATSAETGASPTGEGDGDASGRDLLALDGGAARAQPSSRGGSRGSAADASSPSEVAADLAGDASAPEGELALMVDEPSVYEVVTGDTLLEIAERFGISAETILWANDLAGNADDLQLGQKLTILPVSGVLHEVGPGDTLVEIADAHAVEVSAIVKTNALANADAIEQGQRLVIPGGRPLVVAEDPSWEPVALNEQRAEAAPSVAPPAGPTGRGQEIVNIAARFNGYTYTWGGHAPDTGFDCTGFTWYVYGQAELPIPLHDLWGQLGAGPRVSQSDLLPGDLVFFENTYQPGLSHAGISVGGRMFIHAASERMGVRYDSLDDAYWGPRYFGASRPW